MPYIGSSRYKYSPYLTIHFGSTEKFIPGDAVLGSSTFSQLPAFRQAMALHLSFEESDTYIDHSPANHKIVKWGTGSLTYSASGSVPDENLYSINPALNVDAKFKSYNIYRPTIYAGTRASELGGLTAEGDWRKLMENDFTIEGYYFDSRDLYANGGWATGYMFNIGDENSAYTNQRLLIAVYGATEDGEGAIRFKVGQVSGTLVTVLSITTNVFVSQYYFGTNYSGFYPGPPPKEMNPFATGANNWRYWCIEKHNNILRVILDVNNASNWRRGGAIDLASPSYNFGALAVPSGISTASYSVQPHLSGRNYNCQIAALNSGGTVPMETMTSMYYDDIRITPYARYEGAFPFMGGTRVNFDHFPYNDW